jgi:predicted  nucleic acid-binding Zn-ribbon protein
MEQQAKRKAAREQEEREGLVLIQREEEAIGIAEADIKKMEHEVAQSSLDIRTIECEITDLKSKIEKSYDPSKAAAVEREIEYSRKRLIEAESKFSTAKKVVDQLEGQLSKKKGLLKSKLNLESTIKKHNEDLEERVRTTRKELEAKSSSKKPHPEVNDPNSFHTAEKKESQDNTTPVKNKAEGVLDSQRKAYRTPGSAFRFNSFKTPTKTALRFCDSPGFSPTYELAEIEHGCKDD